MSHIVMAELRVGIAPGRGWEKAGQRLRYDPEPSRSHVVVHEATQRSFDPRCQGGDGVIVGCAAFGSAGAALPARALRQLPVTLARLLAGGTVRDANLGLLQALAGKHLAQAMHLTFQRFPHAGVLADELNLQFLTAVLDMNLQRS